MIGWCVSIPVSLSIVASYSWGGGNTHHVVQIFRDITLKIGCVMMCFYRQQHACVTMVTDGLSFAFKGTHIFLCICPFQKGKNKVESSGPSVFKKAMGIGIAYVTCHMSYIISKTLLPPWHSHCAHGHGQNFCRIMVWWFGRYGWHDVCTRLYMRSHLVI